MPRQSGREDAFNQEYGDARSRIDLGPPGPLPTWPLTLKELFKLAVEFLSQHNKTKADALLHYAGRASRGEMPFSRLYAELTERHWTEVPEEHAHVLDELQCAIGKTDQRSPLPMLREDFEVFQRTLGRKQCSDRTVRRHAKLLRSFLSEASHPYPLRATNRAVARKRWVREHLPAILAHLRLVSCNHALVETTAEEIWQDVGTTTSGSKLILSLLKTVHGTTPAQIRKILSHPSSNK